MICYIVGAGEFYGEFTPTKGDLVIAADGGYSKLTELGITPDVLVGDMDSLPCRLPSGGVEIIRHPVEKDETDAYLAYRIGRERGYTDFMLYGGVGGRPDHTFANYSLLYGAKLDGYSITLVDKDYDIFVINNESVTLIGECGKTFSVFAIGGECSSVTIQGAKYCCESVTLTEAFSLGVSNSFVGTPVYVSAEGGALLVMKEK